MKVKKLILETKNPKKPPNKQIVNVINFINKVNLNIKEKGKINQFKKEPPIIAKIKRPNILFLIIKLKSLIKFIEQLFIFIIIL